jgi:C-terminal processing protease CtpA/Prc
MRRSHALYIVITALSVSTLACELLTQEPTPTLAPPPTAVPTLLPPRPVQPGEANPDEPVLISGTIPFTSRFFINSIAEPFVLLEDEAGFVARDREFEFPLSGQIIGPVDLVDDSTLSYTLPLPSIPTGTMLDVDNDNEIDPGIMVFAVAYWSNTWGDPFLEARDGTGWSNAYTSAVTDPDREDEIMGGKLMIWAPDDEQEFPSGFGPDEMLFTEDDPVTSIPAGYSIVDLDQEPFLIYKESQPEITLLEGVVAVNDYSSLDYSAAFDALFEKASREYPFTDDKEINWDGLYDEFSQRVSDARTENDFYRAIRDFTRAIPDGHVGLGSLNLDVFWEDEGGGLGLVLTELTNGSVIATHVFPGLPADNIGIEVGAEILSWDGLPITDVVRQVQPFTGPFSTKHHARVEQVKYLTRMPPETRVTIEFLNPGENSPRERTLEAIIEVDSYFAMIPSFNFDELELPIEGEVLDGVGLGYVAIKTFGDDYNLLARLWERYIENLIDNEIPGLIIDMRVNRGGNGGLAFDFVEYFFDEEIVLSKRLYYNEISGEFEIRGLPARIEAGPLLYEGEIAVLVSPDCASACEGFSYAITQGGRSIVVGHYPSAGMYGEVGRGQYKLPDDISLQFPTGRPETMDGDLLIEGVGIIPDILVPVTEASALGRSDAVLQAAINALLDRIRE